MTRAEELFIETVLHMIARLPCDGEDKVRKDTREALMSNPEVEDLHEAILEVSENHTRLWEILGPDGYDQVRFWMIALVKSTCKRIQRRVELREQEEIESLEGWGAF